MSAAGRFRNAIGDPLSVWRKARREASRREKPLFAAQRRDEIDASAEPAGLKGDPASVGRERRLDIVCGVHGSA